VCYPLKIIRSSGGSQAWGQIKTKPSKIVHVNQHLHAWVTISGHNLLQAWPQPHKGKKIEQIDITKANIKTILQT